MEFITDFLAKLRRDLFAPKKPFHQFEPIFDAVDTILFSPIHLTHRGPHVRDAIDTKRFMSMVIMALIPCTLFGIYNAGYQSLIATGQQPYFVPSVLTGLLLFVPLVLLSYTVGGIWEVLFAVIRKHPINEGFLVTGLLFPLILPPTIPLWQAAIAISFGVVIGKEVFGGTGMNILNPALVSRAFCFFAYPGKMSGDSVWVYFAKGSIPVDTFSGATPLAVAALHKNADVSVVDALAQHGYTLKNMFLGFIPGSFGETSTLAIAIGGIFLVAVGIASYRTILGCIAGGLFTSFFFYNFASPALSGIYHIPPYFHLVIGGFAFGAVFMATDPVSSAATNPGKWIYGFLIGAIAVLIRTINPAYPEGMMLAILFMNVFSPLIDHYVIRAHVSRRRARHAKR